MFFDKELMFFRRFLDECNLQNFIIDKDSAIDDSLDKGLSRFFNFSEKKKSFSDFFPDTKENTIYRVTDFFMFNYVFFILPYSDGKKVFVTGPYLNTDIKIDTIKNQRNLSELPSHIIRELEIFYSSIPTIREEHLVFAGINTFAKTIFDGSFENADIRLKRSGAFIPFGSELKHGEEDNTIEFSVLEDRYKFENELIEAVRHGDSRKAELMMSRFSLMSFESRTPDILRNIKNYCIIMNTLLRKAAESGGVHPYYINKVSTDFAIKTELITSTHEIKDFMLTMMRTYCLLVKQHSTKNFSPVIQKAVLYIENNLSGDLSLRTLSKESSVSPGYFSSLFRKETGLSLTEYVNTKRTEYAKHLLKTTPHQVQTVAQMCGILDFHYFCRVFKKNTGMTPTQFRESAIIG